MLWLESIPALLDFVLKLLFAEYVTSVSLCHPSSLPQLSVPGKMFSQPIAGGSYWTSIFEGGLSKEAKQLAKSGVAVEKVDLSENRPKRSDQKCIGDQRKSFIGHPDATHFRRKLCERVFQQLQAMTLTT